MQNGALLAPFCIAYHYDYVQSKTEKWGEKWRFFLMPALKQYIYIYSFVYKHTYQKMLLRRNKGKKQRFLDLGPGDFRIPDFETFNLYYGKNVDYIGDAFSPLPFDDGTFDIVYASHILEHCPWYQISEVLTEWKRIIKPGGFLEVFVPDILKISKALVDYETNNSMTYKIDNWYRLNPKKDPAIWFNGRTFSYGDGKGTRGHRNWHLSCFTPRLLKQVMLDAGFKKLEILEHSTRAYDHGWINQGIRAYK